MRKNYPNVDQYLNDQAVWQETLGALVDVLRQEDLEEVVKWSTPIYMYRGTNIIGLGLGPFSVGFFSDVFEPQTGGDSLRYGLLVTAVALLWGVGHYLRCGVLLKRRAQAIVCAASPVD